MNVKIIFMVTSPYDLEPIEKDLFKQNYLNTFGIGVEISGQSTAVFQAYPAMFLVENSDIVTVQWTILKKIL